MTKNKVAVFSGTLCTYIGATYCYRSEKCGLLVGLSVCLSVCHTSVVSPATTAEMIKVPFELRTQVGPGNHVLDGGAVQILPWEEAILTENWRPIVKYRDILRSSVQKWLNRSRCHLGCGLKLAQGIMCKMKIQIPP